MPNGSTAQGCKRLDRPLLAESGLLFQRFGENLTAAILPKAAAKLELR
jgi:hypothetical protein